MTATTGWPLALEPHHDGSALYLDASGRHLGATVRVYIRVPAPCGTTRLQIRSTPDGEPAVRDATVERVTANASWWAVDLELTNPVTRYRFLLDGGPFGRCWLNGAGIFRRDVTDDSDFRINAVAAPPDWLGGAVGYQILIDRFAASDRVRPPPHWAIPVAWSDPVDPTDGVRGRQWFRGDLPGVEQHLDHLERLGVNLIYLTPFFPAGSMHRYDASTFEHVDPALGGDDALASLVGAAHGRGIRVIGDITLNHTGNHHDWFTAARSSTDAMERAFYFFDDAEPHGYVAWHEVPSLPKLDHRSAELRTRFYDGPTSIAARYLDVPFGLDGWRVDCANTTARHRGLDSTQVVARALRSTMDEFPGARWLVAEHCYDAGDDLDGTGWHGVMAYQWFTRPLWAWLKGQASRSLMASVELIDLDGVGVVESMRHLAANVSWESRQASMTMLDSHDTARFRTVVDDDHARHVVGLAALFTMPGVPTLFAGSEVGAEGNSTDNARVPFPWDDAHQDQELLDRVRQLVTLRRSSTALQHGGLRFVDASPNTLTFVRDTAEEVVLVHLARSPGEERRIPFAAIGAGEPAGCRTVFGDGVFIDGDTIVVGGATGAVVVSVPCG